MYLADGGRFGAELGRADLGALQAARIGGVEFGIAGFEYASSQHSKECAIDSITGPAVRGFTKVFAHFTAGFHHSDKLSDLTADRVVLRLALVANRF